MSKNGVLSIFVGQAGIQIGNTFWELLCAEHSVNISGTMEGDTFPTENPLCFFKCLNKNRFVPRCMLIDLEPTVIDEIKSGPFKELFDPDCIINGFEDSGGNFARGFFTVGRLLLPKICEYLRKTLESDTNIIGIIVFRSLGGGTGAGLTSSIFDTLLDLPKITRMEVPIYPSSTISSSTVEPYNALLGEHFCMDDVDLGLLFDNEAMFDICTRQLSIERPTFNNINHLVSKTISCITSSLRFRGILNCDLNVLQTNLVPYPRIHFSIGGFAPVLSAEKVSHTSLTVSDLTNMVFEVSNQLIKIDTLNGKYMSCTMFYRGNISPHEVYSSLSQIKANKTIQFVDWCPTGFKVCISNPSNVHLPNYGIMSTKNVVASLTNCSSIVKAWSGLNNKFQLLYFKKAFMHWFIGEGLEENEFEEAHMNIESLIFDYNEAANESIKFKDPNLSNSDKFFTNEAKTNSPLIINDKNDLMNFAEILSEKCQEEMCQQDDIVLNNKLLQRLSTTNSENLFYNDIDEYVEENKNQNMFYKNDANFEDPLVIAPTHSLAIYNIKSTSDVKINNHIESSKSSLSKDENKIKSYFHQSLTLPIILKENSFPNRNNVFKAATFHSSCSLYINAGKVSQ